MEKLILKLEYLKKALLTLEDSLSFFELKNVDARQHSVSRDSTIKRFEYCTDMFWKILKLYLESYHGVEEKSPKMVYRMCKKVGLFDDPETESFLQMTDDRNETSHTYNEAFAEELAKRIANYYQLMSEIVKKIESKNSLKS